MSKTAVIFGAGKIARGFIAHLLTISGYQITFVERNDLLVGLLKRRRSYAVQIMGAPEKNIIISGFEVLSAMDGHVADRLATADVVFVSIGGPNLPEIVPQLAAGVRRAYELDRKVPLNIILCENYFQPAKWLREMMTEQLHGAEAVWFHDNIGIVESMVLRSTIEPTEEMKAHDPLSLGAQDMWELPVDKSAFVGAIPEVQGLSPKDGLKAGLVRKLFTYNSINAVICYSGYLRGYRLLSEAANDPELATLARTAAEEGSGAMCHEFGFDPQEQREFAEAALAKYQKREIVDPIERNARDPIRKLGRHDRLVGPACLAIEYGIQPVALSTGIAVALRYDHSGDPSAVRLQKSLRELGLSVVLETVCGLDPVGALAVLITESLRATNFL